MTNSIPSHMINEVMACSTNVLTPEVGMLGTYFVGSDRYAIVVFKVITAKKIMVLKDYVDESILEKKVVRNGIEYLPEDVLNGLVERATPNREEYGIYANNSDEIFEWDLNRFNKESTYTLRKNGRWIEAGRGLWECGSIHLGVADPYLDPCF